MGDPLHFNLAADTLESGAFSVVLRNGPRTHAYKLFFSEAADRNIMSNRKRRAIFESEVEAYRIAQADDDLRLLVPQFFGMRQVTAITDSSRTDDITRLFLLDCCYEMELVPGKAVKANEIRLKMPVVDEYRNKFMQKGIKYMEDSLVFLLADRRMKFIDFGVRDVHGDGSI